MPMIRTARILFVALFLLLAGTARAATSFSVYVAYAENERPPTYFPDPWLGSPKTTFLGYPGPFFDTGAVLILNTGTSNLTLSQGAKVDGFADGSSYQLWDGMIPATGLVIPPGNQVILAMTQALGLSGAYSSAPCDRTTGALCYSNFDSSDTPLNHPMVPNQPVIHLTINGTAQTFVDTAQVINTGGFDYGDDFSLNESLQWRPVGTTGPSVPAGTGVPSIVTPFDVTTHHDDAQRTGLNNVESILTPARVASGAFTKINTVSFNGHPDAQPLVISAQTWASWGLAATHPHDVVFVATEGNDVFAIDGVTGAILTQRNFGTPVAQANLPAQCSNNPATVGINSTPVIDPVNKVMYFISYNTVGSALGYYVHKVNLADLSDAATAVQVSASSTLSDGSLVLFQGAYQRQRPGLLLSGGNLYAGFGSFCDQASNYSRGWILGWNASTLAALPAAALMEQQTTAQIGNGLATTQVGTVDFLASIWQSGFGIAADAQGNVYAQTGNSSGIIANNYPDSVVKLPSTLATVSDYFTPSNFATLDYLDEDRGSTGVMVIPDQPSGLQLAVAPGKDGRMFLFNRNNLGKYVANGTDVPPYVSTAACWCSPDYFLGSDGKARVALSSGTQVQTWTIPTTSGANLVADATGVAIPAGAGDPGFMSAVSSYGTTPNTGIIWGVSRAINGRVYLQALDATNGAGGGSPSLNGLNTSVTDKAGTVWSFGTTTLASGDHAVLINGASSVAWAVKIVIANDGNAYHLNSAGQWWTPDGKGGWTNVASPPNARQPSQAGTAITPATGGALTDVSGNVWSFGPVVRNPGEYNQLINGVPFPGSFAIQMIVASDGTVWSKNYAKQWYTFNGSAFTLQSGGPSTFVPSRFGATIIPAYGGSLTDSSGNTWSFGTISGNGPDYNILLNGAATIAHGIQISIDNTGKFWHLNSVGAWWTGNGSTWTQGAAAPNLFAPVIGSYVTIGAAGQLRELQFVDTGAWAVPASGANVVPVVANGQVYVATTNALTIWGIEGTTAVEGALTTTTPPPVTPVAQTITFAAIPAQTKGATLALAATASSGLAVSYTSSTTTICTVSGSTVSTLAAGTCTIVAAQAGNANYLAATPVSQSFTVTAPAATPSFTLSLSAPTLTLSRGAGSYVTLSTTPVNGFTGSVSFTQTGVPAAVNNTFLATGGVNQDYFVVYVGSGAATGTYPVTLKGTSGTTAVSISLTLVIQ